MPCKRLQSWVRQITIKSLVNYYCSNNLRSTRGIKSHSKTAEAVPVPHEGEWFLEHKMSKDQYVATLLPFFRFSSYLDCSTEISKRTAWMVDQKAADVTCAPLLRSTAFSGQNCFKKLPRLHSDDHSTLCYLPNSCHKK